MSTFHSRVPRVRKSMLALLTAILLLATTLPLFAHPTPESVNTNVVHPPSPPLGPQPRYGRKSTVMPPIALLSNSVSAQRLVINPELMLRQ